MAADDDEVVKNHLQLLREEYSKLQSKHKDIESKYNNLLAATGGGRDLDESTFIARLLKLVSQLYDSRVGSDLSLKLSDGEVRVHKLILAAASDSWNLDKIGLETELDWTDRDPNVSRILLKWIYTTSVRFEDEQLAIDLIKEAHKHNLAQLVELCERHLISVVSIRKCVRFYSLAEEIGAVNLRDYCSEMISANWNDLTTADFEHMNGPLLYSMLKTKKTKASVLHSAVRLQRADVVFLALVDDTREVNVWSDSGDSPLDLALKLNNKSIAETLVRHGANVNLRDSSGCTLLHRAIRRNDASGAMFLLDNNCDAHLSTEQEGDSALHLLAATVDLDESNEGTTLTERLIELQTRTNINAQNRDGLTALHLSIRAENLPIFTQLIESRAVDLNVKDLSGHPPLYYALIKVDREEQSYADGLLKQDRCEKNPIYANTGDSLLQVLIGLERCVSATYLCAQMNPGIDDIERRNKEQKTALQMASKNNKFALLIGELLRLGADPYSYKEQELGQDFGEAHSSPIHLAVKSGTLEIIQVYVEHKLDLNRCDASGDPPLFVLGPQNSDLIRLLVEKGGANVDARSSSDNSGLLERAILSEDQKSALLWLEMGATPDLPLTNGETALELAVRYRLEGVVDALCKRGISLKTSNGDSLLWTALELDDLRVSEILVKNGADLEHTEDGSTLLHRAIDANREDAAVFLIQHGADVEARLNGATPIHLCAQWGLLQVVRTLIEHGCDVNARDPDKKTALHHAIEQHNGDLINLLLAVPQLDLTLRDNANLTPFAAALTRRNNTAAQSILEKLPAAAEQFDARGQNFLHIALKKGDVESALFLLTVHVDVNSRVQDALLTPPLHLAARHANETLVRSLLLAGARVDDRDSQKRTALHVAAEAGNASAASALLQNNADYDALDAQQNNALHIAVKEGHLAVIRVLLTESTIDAEAVNLMGRNPLHELARYGKDNAAAICELFLECMPDYPIDRPDVNGNAALLTAYMKGHAKLCSCLVKNNARVACENHDRVTIFNYQVPSKQLLTRLLDELTKPAGWFSTDACQECGKNFSLTVRTHHCRHCGRSLCSRCSATEVPILKFGEMKPLRVCKVCFDLLQNRTGDV